MKLLHCFVSGVLLAALTGIPALAQQDPQQQPPSQSHPTQPQAEPGAADSSGQQAFTGTIVKTKSGYTLRDEASQSAYTLDDPTQARKFVGKNVKVTGALDSSSNTIHVSNIVLVSNSY